MCSKPTSLNVSQTSGVEYRFLWYAAEALVEW